MGHIELAAPAVHIWYLVVPVHGLPTSWHGTEPKEELKAKQARKGHLLSRATWSAGSTKTSRHEDCPSLRRKAPRRSEEHRQRARVALERSHQGPRRRACTAREGRRQATELKTAPKAGDKDLEASATIRHRARLVERVGTSSRRCSARQIIEDEMLWREIATVRRVLRRRHWVPRHSSSSSTGSDFDAEEIKLRDAIRRGDWRRLSAQRKQKPSSV